MLLQNIVYRKGLDVYTLAKQEWAKRKKLKPFPHKIKRMQ